MQKTTKGKTVEITDPGILPEYTPPQTETDDLSWLEEFGTPANLISIRLCRYKDGVPVNNQGFHPHICSYETPPTLDQIKAEHGGGNYMLVVKYRDENTTTGTNTRKVSFSIEGAPKTQDTPANSQNSNGNAPPLNANPQSDILDVLIKAKQAGLIADTNGGSGETALILKSIENTNNLMLEMFKAMNTNKGNSANDAILNQLLQSALSKNKGELDDFAKWIDIIEKMRGEGSNDSEIMQLIKSVAPALLPAIMNRNQAPAQQLQPRQVIQNPAARQNGVQQIPQNIAQPVNPPQLDNNIVKLAEIAARFNINTLDEIEELIDEKGETPEHVYNTMIKSGQILNIDEFNFYLEKLGAEPINEPAPAIYEINNNENLNNKSDMFGMLKGFNLNNFIQGLKDAEFNERVITLKQAANMFSKEQIYNFCLKNEIVTDEKDFNKYMIAAGLDTIPEPQTN